MKLGISLLLAAAIALPNANFAADAENAQPAAQPTAQPATEPAAQPATQQVAAAAQAAPTAVPAPPPVQPAPARKDDDVIKLDWSGWILLNTYFNQGSFNANEQPFFATTSPAGPDDAVGFAARQTRLRLAVTVPNAGGHLGGAVFKGFVETDFAGGFANNNEQLPIPRLRHAWVSATWKQLGDLTVMLGQNWAILQGTAVGFYADSIGHITIPRFAQAGQLFRRAPQLRVSGEVPGVPGGFGVNYQVAALANQDTQVSDPNAAGSMAQSVGQRGSMADYEGRLGFYYKRDKQKLAEVGVSGHYGEDRFILNGQGNQNKIIASEALAVDIKFDVPTNLSFLKAVGLVVTGFTGQNLDIWASGAPGVYRNTVAIPGGSSTALVDVNDVATSGGFAQIKLTPIAGSTFLAGAGVESPDADDLRAGRAASSSFRSFDRNRQLSFGFIQNLTKQWKLGVEWTRFMTDNAATPASPNGSLSTANQIEVGTLLAL